MHRPCLLACLVLLSAPLHALDRKNYPLRIQVQKTSYGCSNCTAVYPTNSTDPPGRFQVDPNAVA